jgi:general secretion pathway protein K
MMAHLKRKILSGDRSGFVLLAVIWMAGLLAVISTAFVVTVRSHTLIARNVVYNSKAGYIADGMVKFSALQLVTENSDRKSNLSGETRFCQWSRNVIVGIRIQDQGGLVDLNIASPDLILALFRGVSLSPSEASDLMAALQDYRDPDLKNVTGGVEPVTYPGKVFGPKNGPFAIIEELDQLPGMNNALFKQLMPLVTVHSQQTGFDLTRAPKTLISALGGNSAADLLLARFSSPSAYKIFAIDAVVETKQNAHYFRHAIVALVLQPDRPFAILSWQHGLNVDDWSFPKSDQKPCFN